MTLIAGIDEAGRGPVIGPMVMAIVACADEESLRKRGMKDSKLLLPEQRRKLAGALRESADVKYEIIALMPSEIDAAVLGKGMGDNLNHLEARTTALLIYRLAKRVPISTVIIDSPTRTVANYEREVRAALDKLDHEGVTRSILLRAEIKADYNHPVVGAASILAKTARDEAIEEISAIHGPIGSGYPSDPLTQSFLAQQWKEPHDFFRKSWESYQRLAQSRQQSSLVDFGVDDERRKREIEAFEALREHNFEFVAPTSQYEVIRMKSATGVSVIKYSTGKVLIQGPEPARQEAEVVVTSLGLGTVSRPRGRPKSA
jgi:ribonuclease HII